MGNSARARFGRYEIIEPLALGGMAQLFRARAVGAHGFHKQVVIKKILPHLAGDPMFRAMFVDEAKISVRLVHPRIVQVLELGTDDGELFIAMELVDGLDLLAVLRACAKQRRELPLEIAVHIAVEVLDALSFAHDATDEDGASLGIVHRDISPGNVLVSRRGDVKLTDFGIARAAERSQKTQTGTLKGKFSYMSPEQISGAEIDSRSDLFSVGTLLAEMLMGRHLFAAPNELDVLLQVRDARLDRLDTHGGNIPADLRALLLRALTRRPGDRYQTAASFRDALADWLFEQRHRVGPRELATLMLSLDDTAVPAEIAAGSSLSGPTTRKKQLDAAESARVGRALFSRGQTSPPEPSASAVPIAMPVVDTDGIVITEAPPEESSPDLDSDLRSVSPILILTNLAVAGRTGRLLGERGEVMKEAYFEDGHPVFVRSNLPEERLGQFLVRREMITADELAGALAVLPHFGGRLGDTLVGLGLMKPMDAVRYLAQQVREKLVELCDWDRGRLRWYERERNPWPAIALHLDTHEIVARSVAVLAADRLEAWGARAIDQRPTVAAMRVDPAAYRLGGRLAYVFNLLDGHRTVGELIARFNLGDQRVESLRMLYLLIHTGAARFA